MAQGSGAPTVPASLTRRQSPPADHVASILSMSQAATGTSDQQGQACDVLAAMRSIVPYAAASIVIWDPLTGQHQTLVNDGYPSVVSAHLNGGFVESDELYRFMRTQSPLPLRWKDTPFDYRHRYSARSVFMPAGFDEGMSALLFSADHRYTGVLHLSVENQAGITDDAVASVTWLQTLLSPLVDEFAVWSRLAQRLSPNSSAILIAPSGATADIPDRLWARPANERDDLVAAVMREWARLEHCTSHLLWQSPRGQWLKLWVHRIPSGLLVLVDEQDHRPPYSLTDREVAVIGGVVVGRSNQQMAKGLKISARTVAKHLENIRHKTATASRTELCARALREGFVPLAPGNPQL